MPRNFDEKMYLHIFNFSFCIEIVNIKFPKYEEKLKYGCRQFFSGVALAPHLNSFLFATDPDYVPASPLPHFRSSNDLDGG